MWEIKIEPKQIYLDATRPKVETLRIRPFEHNPETGITYNIEFISGDPAYNRLGNTTYILQGPDYENWGADMPYLENLILNFVGAVKYVAPIPDPTPQP
jgi:hypothetical protein